MKRKNLVLALLVLISILSFGATTREKLAELEQKGIYGERLQNIIKQRAEGIMPYNRPYIFNGVQDCYGTVRQVWNAVLYDGGAHAEDFSWAYNKSRWIGVDGGLPVGTAPDGNWQRITDLNQLKMGDILATHQGHAWGGQWHGGMYAGKDGSGHHFQWDNSHIDGLDGFYRRNFWSGFLYYYVPAHNLLAKGGSAVGTGMISKVFGVKKNGDSGKTEVYVMTKKDNFTTNILQKTLLGKTGTNWFFSTGDYNRDGVSDLFCIMKTGTGSGMTEVHILNGADNYKSFVLQVGTALGQTGDDWTFAVGDYNGDNIPDLYCIDKSGTGSGKTEVHILNGASSYKNFLMQTGTGLGYVDGNWTFALADSNGDGKLDLYGIVRQNTGSGKTEIHALDGASNFQNFSIHSATALGYLGDNWNVGIADYNGDGKPDLFGIAKYSTGSGKTEVHVLNGANNFQNFLLQTASGMGYTDSQVQFFAGYDKDDDNLKYYDSRVFDAGYYKGKYGDLASAFGNDTNALKKHWVDCGMKEGRQGCVDFDSASYLGRYSDLKNAFGTNYRAAVEHYLSNGIREGRFGGVVYLDSRVFDGNFYKGKYADLAKAFGDDASAYKSHWLSNGISEGRQACSGFSSTGYMARYLDLRNAFGANNYKAAIEHYLTYGIKEGRDASPMIQSTLTIETASILAVNTTITVTGTVPAGITKVKGYIDDIALAQGEVSVVNGRYQFPMYLTKTGNRVLKIVGTGSSTITVTKNVTVK